MHPHATAQRTLRLAWLFLWGAFGVFLLLLATGLYSGWHYYTHATHERAATLIVRASVEWITWQRAGRSVFERTQDQQPLSEGSRLRIASSAGYGQASTIRLFDQSTLDMWAGADITLETLRTTRWNDSAQVVEVRQHAGYVRYDLHTGQPYDTVRFRVRVGNTVIALAPGGSYSVALQRSERQVSFTGSPVRTTALLTDIAVRTGSAQVTGQGNTVLLRSGERVLVDPAGVPSAPLPALWELVEDGSFQAYSEEAYNNTTIPGQPALIRSRTWRVYSVRASEDAAGGGFFDLSRICPPPRRAGACRPNDRANAARFVRAGGQTSPFVTGVRQMLGAEHTGVDISEYRSLIFSVWVRVHNQSLALAGQRGTECPVMVRFLTKQRNPTDAEQERVVCFYASDDPAAQPQRTPNVTYYRVERGTWYHLRIDLRADMWLPTARYLRSIDIYANGHDYDAEVTAVSLVGSHSFVTDMIDGSTYQPPPAAETDLLPPITSILPLP